MKYLLLMLPFMWGCAENKEAKQKFEDAIYLINIDSIEVKPNHPIGREANVKEDDVFERLKAAAQREYTKEIIFPGENDSTVTIAPLLKNRWVRGIEIDSFPSHDSVTHCYFGQTYINEFSPYAVFAKYLKNNSKP